MTDFWARRDGFWNRGGFWKAVLVGVGYLVLFFLASQLVGILFADLLEGGGPLDSAANTLIYLVIPIGLGAVIITVFLAVIGWLRPIFGRQPISGRGWMWIAVAVVAYPIVLRLIGMDYGAFAPGVVALTLLAGLFIGIAEELVTRGAAVALLRKGGYRELPVAVLSSVIFALLHLQNALSTGFTIGTGVQLVYTFFFGICMYLVMRVTGSIVWPIVLHALTDPTAILAEGGIGVAADGVQNALLVIASTGNYAVILFGIVALFFIRGRIDAQPSTSPRPA